MRAFWWFKENSVAGMARPGFNSVHWFDLPFDEAALMGWLGQQASGSAQLDSFEHHLNVYVPKIFSFHKLDETSGRRAIKILQSPSGMLEVLERLNRKVQVLDHFEIKDNLLHLSISENRLRHEAQYLKSHGIKTVVSLTEKHHNTDILSEYFNLHHIGIEDLGAPKLEQAQELSHILDNSAKSGGKVAVHCMAGIGRTSTMLMTSHLLLGENFEDLNGLLSKQNPSFTMVGSQGEFIHSVAQSTFKTQVVAAIIQKKDKFLLGKRSLNKKSAPGYWSPISGRVELGETEAQAIVRECFEEIGLQVRACKKITEFDIDEGKARLHWWTTEILAGEEFLKNNEHSELRWMSIDEMKNEQNIFAQDIEVFSRITKPI